ACEFKCAANYHYDDSTKTCKPYTCTGTTPSNAALCTGDDTGLTADTAKALAASCGTAKCEYTCNQYSTKSGNSCALNTCSLVTNADLCAADEGTSVPANEKTGTLLDSCTAKTLRKCEYSCNVNSRYDAITKTCILNTPPVVSLDDSYAFLPSTSKVITAIVTDPDGDDITVYNWQFLNMQGSVIVDQCTATRSNNVITLNCPTGTYRLRLTAIDSRGAPGSDTATLNICSSDQRVSGTSCVANTAPVATDRTQTTNEDTSLDIDLAKPATCTDADNDPLTYSANKPSYGTTSVKGSIVTYTPDANWYGKDSFTYKCNDGTADSKAATVTVNVNSVNDLPTAEANGPYAGKINAPVTLSTSGSSDIETPVDALTYAWTPVPQDCTVLGNTITCTTSGSKTITLRVTDSSGGSGLDRASLNICSSDQRVSGTSCVANTAPVATDRTQTTNEDTSLDIDLAKPATCTDADNDPLTYSANKPSYGTTSVKGSIVTYTPDANWYGKDSFTYKCNDGTADSKEATVTVNVNSVNDAPKVNTISYIGECKTGATITISCDVYDIDQAANTLVVKGWAGQCDPNTPKEQQNCFNTRSWVMRSGTIYYENSPLTAPDSGAIFTKTVTITQPVGTAVAATCRAIDSSGVASDYRDAYPICEVGGCKIEPTFADIRVIAPSERGGQFALTFTSNVDLSESPLVTLTQGAKSADVIFSSQNGRVYTYLIPKTIAGDVRVSITGIDRVYLCSGNSLSDVRINTPPIAHIEKDSYAGVPNAPVQVSGSIDDPEVTAKLQTPSYRWRITKDDGASTTACQFAPRGTSYYTNSLSTYQNPDVKCSAAGRYRLTLEVDDGLEIASTSVPLTINTKPVAVPGVSYTTSINVPKTLSGSTRDPDKEQSHTYLWSVSSTNCKFSNAAGEFVLEKSTEQNPTIKCSVARVYTLTLKVNDGIEDSDPVTTSLTVNSPPTDPTVLIEPATVYTTSIVTAKASSTDTDTGDTVTYKIRLTKTLPGKTETEPLPYPTDWQTSRTLSYNLCTPVNCPVGTMLKFYARAYDGKSESGEGSASKTVSNTPPVADAGDTYTAVKDAVIKLDGSIDDPEVTAKIQSATFLWKVAKSDGSPAPECKFKAAPSSEDSTPTSTLEDPYIFCSAAGSYTLILIVGDKLDTDDDTAMLIVETVPDTTMSRCPQAATWSNADRIQISVTDTNAANCYYYTRSSGTRIPLREINPISNEINDKTRPCNAVLDLTPEACPDSGVFKCQVFAYATAGRKGNEASCPTMNIDNDNPTLTDISCSVVPAGNCVVRNGVQTCLTGSTIEGEFIRTRIDISSTARDATSGITQIKTIKTVTGVPTETGVQTFASPNTQLYTVMYIVQDGDLNKRLEFKVQASDKAGNTGESTSCTYDIIPQNQRPDLTGLELIKRFVLRMRDI
ncbi:MAG: tandem-95 repeat protein, partial [Candidatus Aenigmarchaeota archaeon]|nr:tandem-95 repeat protein [Candidatus Aenigmarchaeota archaeon]